jgi:hypothetical protein
MSEPDEHNQVSAVMESNETLIALNLEGSRSIPNILNSCAVERVYRRLVFAILNGIERRLDKLRNLSLVLD